MCLIAFLITCTFNAASIQHTPFAASIETFLRFWDIPFIRDKSMCLWIGVSILCLIVFIFPSASSRCVQGCSDPCVDMQYDWGYSHSEWPANPLSTKLYNMIIAGRVYEERWVTLISKKWNRPNVTTSVMQWLLYRKRKTAQLWSPTQRVVLCILVAYV